ncbi:MAG: hypothetical protein HEEMFOPI_01352 [Holosporales bacterium]
MNAMTAKIINMKEPQIVESREDVFLSLINAIEKNPTLSQRELAMHSGVALGVMNAYLKHCVKKGWIRISKVPAKRFAYFLTPEGFALKSKMIGNYLKKSFSFYKQAKLSCECLLETFSKLDKKQIFLVGNSELSDIFLMVSKSQNLNVKMFLSEDHIQKNVYYVVTDLEKPQEVFDYLCSVVSYQNIFGFDFMHLSQKKMGGV